jgi:hypothetical protein
MVCLLRGVEGRAAETLLLLSLLKCLGSNVVVSKRSRVVQVLIDVRTCSEKRRDG